MPRTAQEDLRVRRTITAIDKAFHELVLEKPYDRISVSELCERAFINKKTFYAHYRSLGDVLREKLEAISRGFIARIARFTLPEQLYDIHREYFLYSIEQGEFYEKLICNTTCEHIGSGLLGNLVRDTWQHSPWFHNLNYDTQSMVLCFLHSTGAALYRQWVSDGKRMPLEDVIAISGTLLCQGVEGIVRTAQ